MKKFKSSVSNVGRWPINSINIFIMRGVKDYDHQLGYAIPRWRFGIFFSMYNIVFVSISYNINCARLLHYGGRMRNAHTTPGFIFQFNH